MITATAPAAKWCPAVGQPLPVREFRTQPCPGCGKTLEPLLSLNIRRHEPPKPKRERGEPMTTITIDARNGETAAILKEAAQALRGTLATSNTNPDARYRVAEPRGAFGPAPDLESLAADLIDRYPETFGHLAEFTIRVLWKAKAGAKGGKAVIGKCQKPSKSSLLGHYEQADYVIWLAADYILNAGFTHRQVMAALAHELMHTGKDDDDNPILVPHDFEGFRRELELFGFWDSGLKQVEGAVQARMKLEETGEVEDGDEDDDRDLD